MERVNFMLFGLDVCGSSQNEYSRIGLVRLKHYAPVLFDSKLFEAFARD